MRSLSAILFAISYLISAHIAPCAVIVRVIATTPDYQAIIQAAVIGHWKLDESSGSALDSGPNGFDLTDNNTVGVATGQVDGGRDFVATNSEYFSHADNSLFTPSGDFTVCCLVKLTTDATGCMMAHSGSGGNRSWHLLYVAGGNFRFSVSENSNDFLSSNTAATATTATWYFVVGRKTAGSQISINFTAMSASARSATVVTEAHTGSLNNSTAEFRIGNRGDNSLYVNGALDEVGVFDEAISDAALDAYFLQLKAGVGLYGTW